MPGGEDSVCGACGVGWAETMRGLSDPAEPEAAGHTQTHTQSSHHISTTCGAEKKSLFSLCPSS